MLPNYTAKHADFPLSQAPISMVRAPARTMQFTLQETRSHSGICPVISVTRPEPSDFMWGLFPGLSRPPAGPAPKECGRVRSIKSYQSCRTQSGRGSPSKHCVFPRLPGGDPPPRPAMPCERAGGSHLRSASAGPPSLRSGRAGRQGRGLWPFFKTLESFRIFCYK